MGPNQSVPSTDQHHQQQGPLPVLGVLIPEPLLEECATLQDEFDDQPMGVAMQAERLQRFKYLLSLVRLPLDEDMRAEYKPKVDMAIKFRHDFEYLRSYLLRNGDDGELESSTLWALERQRLYFCPEDRRFARAIRKALDNRRIRGEVRHGESSSSSSRRGEGRTSEHASSGRHRGNRGTSSRHLRENDATSSSSREKRFNGQRGSKRGSIEPMFDKGLETVHEACELEAEGP